MKDSNQRSLASSIFIPFTLLTFVATALFGIFSQRLISQSVSTAFIEQIRSRQKLFAEQISQDVLSGADFEIYRKCKIFMSEKDVVKLSIPSLDGRELCDFKKDNNGHHEYRVETPIYFDEKKNELATIIRASYSAAAADAVLFRHSILLLVTFLGLLLLQYLLGKKVSQILSSPITLLSKKMNNVDVNDLAQIQSGNNLIRISEVAQLYNGVEHLITTISAYQKELVEKTKEATMGRIATQVAHDIRSPLSSMQAALGYLNEIEVKDVKYPEVINLLQLSAKRLTGIADGLLQKNKTEKESENVFSIHLLLDELVGEYQGQEQNKQIRFIKQYSSQSIEVLGVSSRLQRAFGNIIKNAMEAMDWSGTITLQTNCDGENAAITIADTGPGMSPDTLQKVLGGGYTEGKEDGHGIGMTVVRETVNAFGGRLSAESEVGKGTRFFLQLPLAAEEAEEIFTLQIVRGKSVIVIDDDPSLREQWRMILRDKNQETILCESWEDFENQQITSKISSIAIIDYHFENSELNGLQVLRKLKEQGFTNLYLCTAEYWKPSIQKEAKELGVTICPKPLPKIVIAEGVIASEAKQSREIIGIASSPLAPRNDKAGYTVLVIDDDAVIRMGWSLMKEKLHIETLHCFASLEEMQTQSINLSEIDIAFVDKNIDGSAFNGATVLNYLKSNGVSKIVLASGEREEDLKADPQFALADFVVNAKIPRSFKEFFS
ncbi:MAG: ATP-binding protein [Deltaproteobacteria bacterium]|nr:ATP-binding protein [Deltaproteobacteria bacterium]